MESIIEKVFSVFMVFILIISFLPRIAIADTIANNQPTEDTWKLVWEDDFSKDTSIDTSKWNFTIGAGGYGNNELQYYTDRPDNARIENGKLVIEARKENYKGSPYTSAKLSTQGKFSFTYGKVEVKARLPEGKGVWPAIWMMPEDMSLYGGWPSCGEIDIMELLGHEPNKVYGTIHYGNPHTYHGGNYTLPDGKKFSDDFHVFALEWEPGEIRWYVDDVLYYKTSDWFSRSMNEAFDYTYPAPFDRDFYLILNVAVGGNWPGYPPDDANYFPQRMEVEYVKVYQKATYKEAVKPVSDTSATCPENARPPLADGNLIYNGSFNTTVDNVDGIPGVPNTSYWQFVHLDQFGGNGTIENTGQGVKINITNGGSQTYSVQLMQRPICLIKGKTYKLSFDAKSDGQRTIEAKLSSGGGDDGNTWIDYARQTFTLDNNWNNYSYVFTMQNDTYVNSRLEFNVGLSTLPVYINNVRLEEYNLLDPNAIKEPLPNGNLIYNGTFDQGIDRFVAWEFIKSENAVASYEIGSLPDYRYFKSIITDGGKDFVDIKLVQSNLKVKSSSTYLLNLKAKAFDSSREIKVYLSDQNYNPISDVKVLTLSSDWDDYRINLITKSFSKDCRPKLVIEFGGSNVNIGLDNISMKEVSPSSFVTVFPNQFYALENAQIGNRVVSFAQNGKAKFDANVPKSGNYVVSFKLINAQENSSLKLIASDKTYEIPVHITDDKGVIVTKQVYLNEGNNNIEINAKNIELAYIEISPNLIKNGDFSNGLKEWTYWIDEGGNGNITTSSGQLKAEINNIGNQFWSIQIIQGPMELESGKIYRISFDAKSTEPRDIFIKIDDSVYYGHLEKYIPLTTIMKNYTFDFVMDSTRSDIRLVIGLGNMGPGGKNPDNISHIVTMDNIKIAEVSENNGYFDSDVPEEISNEIPSETETPRQNIGDKLLPEGQFNDNSALDYWRYWSSAGNNVLMTVENGELKVHAVSLGNDPWDPQIYREGITLINGNTYKISFKVRASADRKINVAIGKPLNWDPWFIEYMPKKTFDITKDTEEYEVTFKMDNSTDTNAKLVFEIGKVDGYNIAPFNVYFDEIQIEVVDPNVETKPESPDKNIVPEEPTQEEPAPTPQPTPENATMPTAREETKPTAKEVAQGKVVTENNVITLIVEENKILKDITDKSKKEIQFNLTDIAKTPVKVLEVPVGVLYLIAENNKNITVKADEIALQFNAKTLTVSKETLDMMSKAGSVRFVIENRGKNAANSLTTVSNAYDITLKAGENKMKIDSPIKVTFEIKDAKDIRKVGVYYLNETTGKWEYVGGKVDKNTNTVIAEVKHFSTYGAFEYDKQFKDVPKDFWGYDVISVLASRHIVKGMDDDTFAPNAKITRAEFAALMIRALGIPEEPYKGEFEDVKEGAWYANAVEAAYQAGIMIGDGKKMRPDDPITREEMAAVIMRVYGKLTGYKEENIENTSFADNDKISEWAKNVVANAVKLGIVRGYENNAFRPQNNATRAETVAMLYRILGIVR